MSDQLDIFDVPPVDSDRELIIAEDCLRIAYEHMEFYTKTPLHTGSKQTEAIAQMNMKIEECNDKVLKLKRVTASGSAPVE